MVYRIYATEKRINRYYIDIEAKNEDEAIEAVEGYLDASDCEVVYGDPDDSTFEWEEPEEVDEESMFVVKNGEPIPTNYWVSTAI